MVFSDNVVTDWRIGIRRDLVWMLLGVGDVRCWLRWQPLCTVRTMHPVGVHFICHFYGITAFVTFAQHP